MGTFSNNPSAPRTASNTYALSYARALLGDLRIALRSLTPYPNAVAHHRQLGQKFRTSEDICGLTGVIATPNRKPELRLGVGAANDASGLPLPVSGYQVPQRTGVLLLQRPCPV